MTAKAIKTRARKRRRAMIDQHWLKAAAWIVQTIEALHAAPSGHGLKWTGKMINHYKKQYTQLCARVPKRCEAQKRIYDTIIERILKKYSDYI